MMVDVPSEVAVLLERLDYSRAGAIARAAVFRAPDMPAILIEGPAESYEGFAYVDYTSQQNQLMHEEPRGLFRFSLTSSNATDLARELERLTDEDWPSLTSRRRGADRERFSIDPTKPEALFEGAVEEAFGVTALHALAREVPMSDAGGGTRYVDYVVRRSIGDIAVELNGENFHHPAAIGQKRYASQLLKQNSLVARGMKVFRWSIRGMQEAERFIEELHRYIGPAEALRSKPLLRVERSVAVIEQPGVDVRDAVATREATDEGRTFELLAHQQDALDRIEREREAGCRAFVVTLPTGTGKTEVALADYRRLERQLGAMRGLFLVPTSHLREQVLRRCRARLPNGVHGTEPSERGGFTVQTYAWATRSLGPELAASFDYAVVDEAHHVMAPSLRRVVEQLDPHTLLGLTATPERLDGQSIEEVFGKYQTSVELADAIEIGLVPPIRAFRLESNIDLSELRFRGRDYTASDLQRTIVVDSRDKLVADTLERFFPPSAEQATGVIVFCVSVDHAERMATTFYGRGYRAVPVSGKYRAQAMEHVAAFRAGRVDILCACDLLTEGFDAPETKVLVMARPTLSKALYTQQIGRGTRWSAGKEALYVIDVVDRYGPLNAPWSIHALLGESAYLPFADVVRPRNGSEEETEEQARLIELLEYERRIDRIDLFTFEREYGDFLSEEQASRVLFTTKPTLRKWVDKGEAEPSLRVPFGKRELYFFFPERVDEIRESRGLKVRDASTQLEDFDEFIEERKYTASYKPVLVLSMLKRVDSRGGAELADIREDFREFYQARGRAGLQIDRGRASVASEEVLRSDSQLEGIILRNPFEKFERRRFMRYAKDLGRIEFAWAIWESLRTDEARVDKLRQQMLADLEDWFREAGGSLPRAEVERLFPLSQSLTAR
jgi:superfamily II DNA or RNA helicase